MWQINRKVHKISIRLNNVINFKLNSNKSKIMVWLDKVELLKKMNITAKINNVIDKFK